MISELPQELLDHILDQLVDDQRSLKASSLASRLFLPRTRTHLFRSFAVKSYRTCETFKLLLPTPLAAHIRALHVATFVGLRLPDHMTNLRSVSFSEILYTSDSFVQDLARSPMVTSVTFAGPSIFVNELASFRAFIRTFPCLRRVTFNTFFQFRHWTLAEDVGDGLQRHLDEIVVDFANRMRTLLTSRLRLAPIAFTKKLVFRNVTAEDLPVIQDLVDLARDNLEELSCMSLLGFIITVVLIERAVQFAEGYDLPPDAVVVDLHNIPILHCSVGTPDSSLQDWWLRSLNVMDSSFHELRIHGGTVSPALSLLLKSLGTVLVRA